MMVVTPTCRSRRSRSALLLDLLDLPIAGMLGSLLDIKIVQTPVGICRKLTLVLLRTRTDTEINLTFGVVVSRSSLVVKASRWASHGLLRLVGDSGADIDAFLVGHREQTL